MNSIAMTMKEIAPQSCIMNPICGATRPRSCAWGHPGSGFFLPGVHREEVAHLLPWGEARASEVLGHPLSAGCTPCFPRPCRSLCFLSQQKKKKKGKK